MHKHLSLSIEQQTLSWNLWSWDRRTEILFQSIYPSRSKVCLQKALTGHKQVVKEEYGQSRHMASYCTLRFNWFQLGGFWTSSWLLSLNTPVHNSSSQPSKFLMNLYNHNVLWQGVPQLCCPLLKKILAFLFSKLVAFLFLPIVPSPFTGRD